jgi:hypothetical protein
MATAFTVIFKSSLWHDKLMPICYAPHQARIINTDFTENFHETVQSGLLRNLLVTDEKENRFL